MYDNPFINQPDDLVTTEEARRTGFLEMALRRNIESVPFLNKAKSLYTTLKTKTKTSSDILKLKDLRIALLDAAGVYSKTRSHLSEKDMDALLKDFVKEVLEPCGPKYIDEIVYRYLMSLGEQLGGRMRNIIGVVARIKLTEHIISHLQLKNVDFKFFVSKSKWFDGSQYKKSVCEDIKAIQWGTGADTRMLIHNLSIPNVSKNVDIVVVNKSLAKTTKSELAKPTKKVLASILNDPKSYVVLGELKGGIDPAGADEHWKTARGALQRLRSTFKKASICFIGGAIESAMAKEIYSQLTLGDLDYAANLNKPDQLDSLCGWLIQQ